MLEAFYDKTCLTKCSGNCLEMHFEYLHVSVPQKLTELQIFGCHQLLIAVIHFLLLIVLAACQPILLIIFGSETLDLWSCLSSTSFSIGHLSFS